MMIRKGEIDGHMEGANSSGQNIDCHNEVLLLISDHQNEAIPQKNARLEVDLVRVHRQ